MRYELKSIPIWPVVKVFFPINLVAGFVFGLVLAIISTGIISFYNEMLQVSNPGYDVDLIPLKLVLILMPLLMSFGNAIFTTTLMIIIVFFYNLFMKFTGGVELNLSEINIREGSSIGGIQHFDSKKIINGSAPPPPPDVILKNEKPKFDNTFDRPSEKDIQ